MNILNVRGGNVSFQLTKQITSASILATVFFLIFFSFFSFGVYLLIYTTHLLILALHVYGRELILELVPSASSRSPWGWL